MLRPLFSFLIAFLSLFTTAKAQINAYAEVTGVSGPASVNLASVDESDDSFEDGEDVIIMQMQDDVIGGNTNNDPSFGDLGNIASAGLWEVRRISSHTESGGIPTDITFRDPLSNVYNTGANSSVQLISFPSFGSPDCTMTNEQTAPDWDGATGGVIAFQVPGTLTLESDINADGSGFRGGGQDLSNSGNCDISTYHSSNNDQYAEKGESIHRISNSDHEAARGKILNGGGGGNEHNGGGGGGGNFSAGGEGGLGWDCNGDSAGGLGGISLSAHISSLRSFMGGGGGGGEGNDASSSAGGDGGGIIIIKANEVRTSTSCSGVSITANGETAADAGNDGAGGGGAGGTVHINAGDWSIDGNCPLTIQANGGNGGDVNSTDIHGGGGGGGQGAIIQGGASPPVNATQNAEPGIGGENCDGCSRTYSGGGNDDAGVIAANSGVLPIELLSFDAHEAGSRVKLSWKTMTETDNDRFVLYRSKAGKKWEQFKTMDGAGDSQDPIAHRAYDEDPYEGTSYYRLEQVDFDGERSKYGPIAVRFERKRPLSVHPNPTKGRLFIEHSEPIEGIRIHTPRGERIRVPISLNGTDAMLSASELPPGVYFLEVRTSEEIIRKRFVKR